MEAHRDFFPLLISIDLSQRRSKRSRRRRRWWWCGSGSPRNKQKQKPEEQNHPNVFSSLYLYRFIAKKETDKKIIVIQKRKPTVFPSLYRSLAKKKEMVVVQKQKLEEQTEAEARGTHKIIPPCSLPSISEDFSQKRRATITRRK